MQARRRGALAITSTNIARGCARRGHPPRKRGFCNLSERKAITALARKLVEEVGGYDAAVEIISKDRPERLSKGTLTQRLRYDADWPLVDLWALEDAAGWYPVSRRAAARLERAVPVYGGDMPALFAQVCSEGGDAMGAFARFIADPGEDNRATLVKELTEATAAMARGLAEVERRPVPRAVS